MKPQIISVALIAFAFSGCRPHSEVSNTNSSALKGSGPTSNARFEPSTPCVNLNTANADELTGLEGIGAVIAQRIIDYRERNGRFLRKEQVLIVEGLSEKKYQVIAAKICVD